MPLFANTLMVTDLDATFFSDPSRLSKRTLEAVEFFKSEGGYFTAATGRIAPNIRRAIPTANTLFNAPAITANGACLYDLAIDRVVAATPMDAPRVKAVAALVQELDPRVGMRVSTDTGILVNADRINDAILRDLDGDSATRDRGDYIADIRPISEWETDGAVWYKLVFRGEREALDAIRPTVEATFGEAFEYNNSSARFFELQRRGCHKGTGLIALASYLQARTGAPLRTIAVGDQENDLPMLRMADVAACPEVSLPAVQELSHYHLCSCDEGAIADLIERLSDKARAGT